MGFIQAFVGALGGTFADQWKDYLVPESGLPGTVGIYHAVQNGTDNGRGANTKGSTAVITNGSKIVVPEGTALVTMQDGAITGVITQPGGYTFSSDDANSKSIFAGDGFVDSLVKQTWERIKFGGIPATQQTAFYVNLKEIPNNKFGTQSEIYWDDKYLNAQVGVITRGTYTLQICDPVLFIKNFVPPAYLQQGGPVFDFADMDNDAGQQLFNEVVSSLGAGFSNYTNDPDKGNRIAKIQGDQIGFAQSLSQAVEDAYQWKTNRGLQIVKVAIQAIEYDEDTKALLSDVKKADALSGSRGNSFMQQAVARGFQAAGENDGGTGMGFMGMGVNATGNVVGAFQQPSEQVSHIQVNQQPAQTQESGAPQGEMPQGNPPQPPTGGMSQGNPPQPPTGGMPQGNPPQPPTGGMPQGNPPQQPAGATAQDDPYEKISKLKKLLDEGAITQEEFDAQKAKLLGQE